MLIVLPAASMVIACFDVPESLVRLQFCDFVCVGWGGGEVPGQQPQVLLAVQCITHS